MEKELSERLSSTPEDMLAVHCCTVSILNRDASSYTRWVSTTHLVSSTHHVPRGLHKCHAKKGCHIAAPPPLVPASRSDPLM